MSSLFILSKAKVKVAFAFCNKNRINFVQLIRFLYYLKLIFKFYTFNCTVFGSTINFFDSASIIQHTAANVNLIGNPELIKAKHEAFNAQASS